MARYRVYEELWRDGQKLTHQVYEGEVDPAIIAGQQTLQARPFGRHYHVNGAVFHDDRGERVLRGVSCRFELTTP